MPKYSGELEDGRKFSFESDEQLNEQQVAAIVAQQMTEPETGKLGTFAAHTAAGVPKAFGAAAGAALAETYIGAPLAAPTGGISLIAAPLIGGLIGSVGSTLAEKAALKAVAPKAQEYLETSERQHPGYAIGGELLGAAPVFTVSPGTTVKGLKLIPKVLRGEADKAETKIATDAAMQVGIGTSLGAVQPILPPPLGEGRLPNYKDILLGAGQGLTFGGTRKWIRAVLPNTYHQAQQEGVEDASQEPSAESEAERDFRSRMGEETPLRQQGQAAPPQAQAPIVPPQGPQPGVLPLEEGAPGLERGLPGQISPLPQPQAPFPPPSEAKVPVMITKAMEKSLSKLGYSPEQINKLTPQQANDIIKNKVRGDIAELPKQKTAEVEFEPKTADQLSQEYDEMQAKPGMSDAEADAPSAYNPGGRPPDIIDDLAGVGKLRLPKKAGKASKADYGEDEVAQLFKRGWNLKPKDVHKLFSKEGLTPDDALEALRRKNPGKYDNLNADDLLGELIAAQNQRDAYRADVRSRGGFSPEEHELGRRFHVREGLAKAWANASEKLRTRLGPEYEAAYKEKLAEESQAAEAFKEIDPEAARKVADAATKTGHGIEVQPDDPEYQGPTEGDPFAARAGSRFMTINRKTGKIVIFAKPFQEWWNSLEPRVRDASLEARMAEESMHLATPHEGALNYYNNLSWAEKALERKLYTGRFRRTEGITDTDIGFEAIRRRLQRLAGMDSSEVAQAVGLEKWSLKSLELLNDVIFDIRRAWDTHASQAQLAILDHVQANVNAGIVALGGTPVEPGGRRKEPRKEFQREMFVPPAAGKVERPTASELGAQTEARLELPSAKPGEARPTAKEFGLPTTGREISAEEARLHPADRKFISEADLAEEPESFVPIQQMDSYNVQELGRILTQGGSVSRDTLTKVLGVIVARGKQVDPESVTRRVTVIKDKVTGTVHAVSTYRTGDNVVRILDPGRTNLQRPHVELSQSFLKRYDPLYSVLLDLPVRNFHQRFESVHEFNEKIGNAAREKSIASSGYEAPKTDMEMAAEPAERLPSWRHPITDAEAGRLIDMLYDEVGGKLTEPADVEASLAAISENPTKHAGLVNAYRKLYDQFRRTHRGLTPDETYERFKQEILNEALTSKSREEFIARAIAKGPKAHQAYAGRAGEVRPAESSGPTRIGQQPRLYTSSEPVEALPAKQAEVPSGEYVTKPLGGEPPKRPSGKPTYGAGPAPKVTARKSSLDTILLSFDPEHGIPTTEQLKEHFTKQGFNVGVTKIGNRFFRIKDIEGRWIGRRMNAKGEYVDGADLFAKTIEQAASQPFSTWEQYYSRRQPRLYSFGGEPGARTRTAKEALVKAGAAMERVRSALVAGFRRASTVAKLSANRDAADNQANSFANVVDNHISVIASTPRHPKGDPQIKAAANVLVQSQAWKRDPATGNYVFDNNAFKKLPQYYAYVNKGIADATAKIASGGIVNTYVGSRWLKAARALKAELDYARANWYDPVLQATAKEMRVQLDEQFAREAAAGRPLNYDQGYLPGRYEGEFFGDNEIRFGDRGYVLGRKYGLPKSFTDYYQAISAGPYIAVTRDGANLVSHRIRQGMHRLNEAESFHAIRSMVDPVSGQPVAVAPKLYRDPNTNEIRKMSPSPEHELVELHPGSGDVLAVRKGYATLVNDLFADSWVNKHAVPAAVLHAGQMMKHSLLALDIFHPLRLTYYGLSLMRSKLGFKGGLTALDWLPSDYGKALAAGLIRQKDIDWVNGTVGWRDSAATVGIRSISRRELAGEFQKAGLNVGRIQDALYKDIVSGFPVIGEPLAKYNRLIFDRYTRGLMLQSAVLKYEQLVGKMGHLTSEELVSQISKEINVMFGNIGRQGWFKSRTAQDVIRMMFLAPQWVEGLVKKEWGLAKTPYRALIGKTNVLGKAIGQGILAMFALTQGINLITRGKPTWQNEEEGHMFDAWIPGKGEDNPGFFISPLSVFSELAHDAIRMLETKPKAWDAARQIGENKLGPWGRIALIGATSETPYGQKITTTPGVLQEIGKQLVPTPIGISKMAQAGAAAAAPSYVSPPVPGAVQRQIFSTAGIKIEPARTTIQEIGHKAQRWMRENGFGETGHQSVPTDEASYSKLRAAARNNDLKAFRSNLQELLKTKTPQQIIEAMNVWARRPFTGTDTHERMFLYSLTDAERELWARANDQRMSDLQKVFEMLGNEL